MSKKTAVLNIGKALLVASATIVAAIGGAVAGMTGNMELAALWVGIPTMVAQGLPLIDLIASQLAETKNSQEEKLVISAPTWLNNARDWENICAEIQSHLPNILQRMSDLIAKDQRVKTTTLLQQIFISAFTEEHLTLVPEPDDRRKIAQDIASKVIQKIYQMLEPVIIRIQQEDAYKDIRETALNTQKIATSSEKTASGVEQLVRLQKGESPSLTDAEIVTQRQHYCAALCEQYRMFDFKGIMHVEMNQPLSIPITEVFVFPDVLIGVPEYETMEREDAKSDKQLEEGRRDEQRDLTRRERDSQFARGEIRVIQERKSLKEALVVGRRFVILGDPGAGKSTLLRYLLLRLAEHHEELKALFPQLPDLSSTVPLYMPLAPYADFRQKSKSGERTIKDFIPGFLQDNYLGACSNFIQQQLEAGHVFLLFDGLDEIPDDTPRIEIVRQIEAFTRAYAMNFFIVTSRIVGYKKAQQLAADYQPFTLADFNRDQIKLFAQKWCPTYERWVKRTTDSQLLQAAATREADNLFSATQRNPGVKKLAVNPLLLTILALIQRQGTDLPSHRVKLFNLCADTLIDTWVKASGRTGHFSETELVKILRPLAFWMHEHPAIGAIPEDELTEQVAKQLLQRKLAREEVEATKRAEQFLATVRGQTGILVERGQTGILVERGKQRYGFLHQNFEEYFAARELVLRKDRSDFIKQHLHHARWREVILLAVGIIGVLNSDEEGVTELVEEAILKAGSPFEKWLHRDLLFAGLCFADDVGVSVTCESKIIKQIMDLYLNSPYNSLRKAFDDVLFAWTDTPVARKVVQLVLPNLQDRRLLVRRIGLLKQVGSGNEEVEVDLLGMVTDSDWRVRQAVEGALRQLRSGNEEVEVDLLQWMMVESVKRLLGKVGSENEEAVTALLGMVTDSDWRVRESVARALGQVGSGNEKAVTALFKMLTDSVGGVRASAANALAILPINREAVGHRIEDMLQRYEPIVGADFEASDRADVLLSALQQVVGGV